MDAEPINPKDVLAGLNTQFIGRHILHFDSISTTMNAAHKAAKEGAAEGTIVLAEEQTAGRGRFGRSWITPKGSTIAISVVLHPHLPHLSKLNMVASLAVVRSIESVTYLKPLIKWPNDVLIQGKKVSGMLIDSSVRGEEVEYAIVGIGINVNLDVTRFAEISSIATSLSSQLGREVSRLRVLQHLLREMEELYLMVRRNEPVHEEWQKYLETLGKEIEVRWGGDEKARAEKGYAEAVDENGNLLLRRSDGSLVTVAAGEVTLRS